MPSAAHRLPPLGEKEIASFLDMIEDGLRIRSPDGRPRYANPAPHRLFGLPPKARARSCADLLGCCVDAQGNPLVQFEVVHRAVHRLGLLVQNDVNSGKGEAGELVAELLAASESMLQSLDVFQKMTRA